MSAALFRAQIAPAATLAAFEFDAKFVITSFNFTMLPKGKDLIGPFPVKNPGGCRLTGGGANTNVEKAMQMAHAGDRIFIEDIKAVGPDGQTRILNVISLLLN